MLLTSALVMGLMPLGTRVGIRRSYPVRMCRPQAVSEKAWRATLQDLNAAPVFAIATSSGNFLQHERGGLEPLVLFFADIDVALLELQSVRGKSPELDLQLMPVGLGNAYDQTQQGRSLIVPCAKEVGVAQGMQEVAPPEASAMLAGAGIETPVIEWNRDELPIFGCFRMTRRRRDGSRFTPLFMASAEAQKSFHTAVTSAQGTPREAEVASFEIDCLPLAKVVELAASSEGGEVRVIPPASSLLYLQGKYPT